MQKVSLGYCHSAVVTSSGEVHTWGRGALGLLGHGDLADEPSPRLVKGLRDLTRVVDVACGVYHTLALTVDANVYSWGWGNDGRLGHGEEYYVLSPRKIEALAELEVSSIACGHYHSGAVTSSGALLTWGCGGNGRLGHAVTHDALQPVVVRKLAKCSALALGGSHSAALTSSGLYTWGCGADGRLGHGSSMRDLLVPTKLEIKCKISTVSCGEGHMVASAADGSVLTWGQGGKGQLGHGDEADVHTPKRVSALSGMHSVSTGCGVNHSVVLNERGVWIWGEHGSGSVCSVPQVVRDTGDDQVTMVAAGGFHSTLLAKGSIAAVDQVGLDASLTGVLNGGCSQMSPGSSASSLSSYDAITKLLDNVASPQTRNKLKQVIGSQRPLSSVSRSVSQSGETCDTPQSASSSRTQVERERENRP